MAADERRFSIGRDPRADIVIVDATVSARHAEIAVIGGGRLLLTDCRSRNGTYRILPDGRDERIRQTLVSDLDQIRFGDVRLTVRDLIKTLQFKHPHLGGPTPPRPTSPRPLRAPRELERCERCGLPHVPGTPCPVCDS